MSKWRRFLILRHTVPYILLEVFYAVYDSSTYNKRCRNTKLTCFAGFSLKTFILNLGTHYKKYQRIFHSPKNLFVMEKLFLSMSIHE